MIISVTRHSFPLDLSLQLLSTGRNTGKGNSGLGECSIDERCAGFG